MKKSLIALTLSVLLLSACMNQDPKEINLHTDECTYCKMVVSDRQFATQLVTDKGKSYPFDSIECMAAYTYQSPDAVENAKLYVTDYTRQGQWLLLENADIYRAENVQSPMGLSLLALQSQDSIPPEFADAKKLDWDDTVSFVVEQWDVKR